MAHALTSKKTTQVVFTLLELENDFQTHKMVDVDKYLIWLHKYKRNENGIQLRTWVFCVILHV